jgi:MFS family permease
LMTGVVTSGVGIGALIGPPLANWIISHYDWRTSYFVLGAIVLVGVLISAQFLRKSPTDMGLTPYGFEDTEEGRAKSVTDALGLTLRQALGCPVFWLVSTVFFCYGYMWTAILLHLAPHATDLGYSASNAARLIAVVGAGSILGKVLLGIVADHIGNKQVYVLSFILMGTSLLWLTFMSQLWALYAFALVFGSAYGGLATAHSPLVAWLFGIRKHGLIFGVCFNGFTLGCAVGPIVAGHIFDVTKSYRLAFIICCAMAVAGMLLTLPLKPAALDTELIKAEEY